MLPHLPPPRSAPLPFARRRTRSRSAARAVTPRAAAPGAAPPLTPLPARGCAVSHPRAAVAAGGPRPRGWLPGLRGRPCGKERGGESGRPVGTSKRKWLCCDTSPAGGCSGGPGALWDSSLGGWAAGGASVTVLEGHWEGARRRQERQPVGMDLWDHCPSQSPCKHPSPHPPDTMRWVLLAMWWVLAAASFRDSCSVTHWLQAFPRAASADPALQSHRWGCLTGGHPLSHSQESPGCKKGSQDHQ